MNPNTSEFAKTITTKEGDITYVTAPLAVVETPK